MASDAVTPAMLQSSLNQQSALCCFDPSSQLQLLCTPPPTAQIVLLQQSWPLESYSLGTPNIMQSASRPTMKQTTGFKSQSKPKTLFKSAQPTFSKSYLEKLQELTKKTAPEVLHTKRSASSLEQPNETSVASGPRFDSSLSEVKALAALMSRSIALPYSGKTKTVAKNISSYTVPMKSDFNTSFQISSLKKKIKRVKPPARTIAPNDEEKKSRKASAA